MEAVFSVHANAAFSTNTFGKWSFYSRNWSKMTPCNRVYMSQWMALSSSTSCDVTVKSQEPEQMQLLGYCRDKLAHHSVCVCVCVRQCVCAHPALVTSTNWLLPTSSNPDELRRSPASSPVTRTRSFEPDAQIRSDQSGESV